MLNRAFTYFVRLSLLTALLSLSACGIKGALYLPQNPSQTQATSS
ncbi:LPS translocon maturation chaperone LptM [Sulfuriferula nivalis]